MNKSVLNAPISFTLSALGLVAAQEAVTDSWSNFDDSKPMCSMGCSMPSRCGCQPASYSRCCG